MGSSCLFCTVVSSPGVSVLRIVMGSSPAPEPRADAEVLGEEKEVGGVDAVLAAAAVAADLVGSSSEEDAPPVKVRSAPEVPLRPPASGDDAMIVTQPGPAAAEVGGGKTRGKASRGRGGYTPAAGSGKGSAEARVSGRTAAAEAAGWRVDAVGAARRAAAGSGGPGARSPAIEAEARRVCAAGGARSASTGGGGPGGRMLAVSRSGGGVAGGGGGLAEVAAVGAGGAVSGAPDPKGVDLPGMASPLVPGPSGAVGAPPATTVVVATVTLGDLSGVAGSTSSVAWPGASLLGGFVTMEVVGGNAPVAGRLLLLLPFPRVLRVPLGSGGGSTAAKPAGGDGGIPPRSGATASDPVTPLLSGPARVAPFSARRAAEPVTPFGEGRAAELFRSLPVLMAAVLLLP